MRRLNFIITSGLVVAAFATLTVTVPILASSPKTSSSPFRLKAVMRHGTFFLGVDIPMTAILENTGKKEVRAALQMRPRAPHLIVEDSDGKRPECLMEVFDMEGPDWKSVPPGKQLTLDVNAAEFYRIDVPGRYRLRWYAYVADETVSVYSNWYAFEVVPGKEAFRKDIKVIRPRPQPGVPKREDDSLIVYALPKVHLAYYKRTFQKDEKETSTHNRMVEVDPDHKPQILTDARGEIHILVAHRQLPKNEIEKQFKDYSSLYEKHLRYRHYMWYKTDVNDGRLKENRTLYMAKENKNELRLVKSANGKVEVHEFKKKDKDMDKDMDMGVYRPPWKKPKARSRPSQPPSATKNSVTPKESP